MKEKFNVVVEEVLARNVEVEATDEAEAIRLVTEMYQNSDIVLDSSDFSGQVDINIFED